MNKKLAVLLVVPILLAMGGTFAFSAFSGGSSIAINNTAGHLTWTNNVVIVRTNANNTPLTAQGPNGVIYEIVNGSSTATYNSSGMYKLALGNQSYTTLNGLKEYNVRVNNFAPGEFVEFQATITNTGTVGFMVVPYVLAIGEEFISSNSTYNARDAPITATQVGVSSTSPFSTDLASSSSSGYMYNVTTVSGFHTSLSPEGYATMDIYVGLGSNSGNHYQGSDITLTIFLSVVSDP
jgi:hypothetical protein